MKSEGIKYIYKGIEWQNHESNEIVWTRMRD